MKFEVQAKDLVQNQVIQYRLLADDQPLSFKRFIDLLCDDALFRELHNAVLAKSSFTAFRWETPGVTSLNQHMPYEFVLVNSAALQRKANPTAFRDQFKSNSDSSVLSFPNLGRNAQMIVPCPTGNDASYTHLASFLRGAPTEQVDELWSLVGSEMRKSIQESPRWLSTAGGGVPWLHVRIDQFPKYYHHRPYKTVSNEV